MRKRIFQIVEKGSKKDKLSLGYDIFMIVAIVASIIPLTFISYETPVFDAMEDVTVTIFIIDYVLRWFTADFRLKKGKWSFLLYPFTAWAVLDLLSILPGLELIGDSFKVFRIARLLKILRLFKFVRYSKSIQLVRRVIRKERPVLLTNVGRAISMISSLVGVAVIALPSGVITASYMDEVRKLRSKKNDSNN